MVQSTTRCNDCLFEQRSQRRSVLEATRRLHQSTSPRLGVARESITIQSEAAPREWNVMLTKELVSYGLSQSKSDPVLFTYREGDKITGAVVVHVNDLIITGQRSFLEDISGRLQKRFKMSKVGPIDTYLSLKVKRGPSHEVFLSQEHYIQHIVDSHLPSDSNSATIPCNSLFADLSSDTEAPITQHPYSELIGMLQWVANGTRPNIQFAINRLSQFLRRPTDIHWQSAIHVLRYLNSTKSLRLCLGKLPTEALQGYSDADWALTPEDRRSTTGWLFKYAGGAISWKS